MIKRIALVGAVAVLLGSVAHDDHRQRSHVEAPPGLPPSAHRLEPAGPGDPVEPGAAEGARRAGRPAGLDSPDPHDRDHPDRGVRRRQRDRGRRRSRSSSIATVRAVPRPMPPLRPLPARRSTRCSPASSRRSTRSSRARSLRSAQASRSTTASASARGGRRRSSPRARTTAPPRRRRCSRPGPVPGEYQLTPPAFAPAGFTQTRHVTPFVLQSASQFRPPPPPALTSPEYAADFSEVHSLGELNSTTRTADETAIGRVLGCRSGLDRLEPDRRPGGCRLRQQPRAERSDVRAARHDARRRRDRALRRQVRLPPLASDHRDHRDRPGQHEHDGRSRLAAARQHGQRPELPRGPRRVQPGGRDGAARTSTAPTCSRSR